MTTVANLIDQISSNLHAFTGVIEASTYTIDDVLPNDLLITVQHPERVKQGIIEIEDELLFVDGVDSTSFNVDITPYGRGFQGTTAAAHTANLRVINDPQFPRVRIFDAIKQAILEIQPDLFAVTTTTFTSSPVQTTYEIPAAVDRVLKVEWETIGPSKEWAKVADYSVDHNADTTNFPSGKSITITSGIPASRTVQITYAGGFTSPTSTSDDLVATCKIPVTMHDVIIYNACWRLVQFMPLPRFDLRTVEQSARAQGVDPNAIMNFAKQVYAAYELRKAEERKRLLMTEPQPKRFVTR